MTDPVRLLLDLRLAKLALDRAWEAAAADGLHLRQAMALLLLEQGPQRPADIAANLRTNVGLASRIGAELTRRKLITRRIITRRHAEYTLTPQGRRLAERLRGDLSDVAQVLIGDAAPGDLAATARTLTTILERSP